MSSTLADVYCRTTTAALLDTTLMGRRARERLEWRPPLEQTSSCGAEPEPVDNEPILPSDDESSDDERAAQ